MKTLSTLPDLGKAFNKLKPHTMTITQRFLQAFENTTLANETIIRLCGELMNVADKSDRSVELHKLIGKILNENKKIVEAFEDKEDELKVSILTGKEN